MTLTPAHRTILEKDSGIAPDVIAERRYHSSTGYSELKSLGIRTRRDADCAGILMPLWGVDGMAASHLIVKDNRQMPYTIFRPDHPVIETDGRETKYVNPTAAKVRLDTHPRCAAAMRDPSCFLWITEGLKKGDALVSQGACAIALLGVDCWRVPDWTDVDLKARAVGIVFDSDVMVKPEVHKALTALTTYLTYKGAQVQHVYLPSTAGHKTGVDDFLVSRPLADLEALLEAPRGTPHAAVRSADAWQAHLLTTKTGQPMETFGNLLLCAAQAAQQDQLWYDALADRAMIGEAPLTDALVEQAAATIERDLRMPIRTLRLVRAALVAQCRQRTRDPLKAWLEALPAWDQQPRLGTWLTKYAGAAPTIYAGETGRLWLVSMVARGLQPGCQCRSVIVLMGEEDIGKSKLVKLLASEPWYRDVSGSLEGKEAHMLMKGTWLVELGELSSMGKTEEQRLKSFITMANDEYVPKYANDPIKHARRTILVGTLNPEGDKTFLRGQTGNTRFYPVGVTDINLPDLATIREQLFAEALAYYQDHPDDWWRLTPMAEKEAREIRDEHRVRSVYEEPLSAWLDGRTLTCWQELCEHFLLLEAKERWKDTKLQKDIALAMVACGWQQEKLRRVAPYGSVRPWVPKAKHGGDL